MSNSSRFLGGKGRDDGAMVRDDLDEDSASMLSERFGWGGSADMEIRRQSRHAQQCSPSEFAANNHLPQLSATAEVRDWRGIPRSARGMGGLEISIASDSMGPIRNAP